MIIKNTLPFLGSLIAVMLAAGLSGLVRAEEVLATPKTMASSNYVLQPSDVIRVQIFQEPELLREVRLSQESAISLPMIGAGMADIRYASARLISRFESSSQLKTARSGTLNPF